MRPSPTSGQKAQFLLATALTLALLACWPSPTTEVPLPQTSTSAPPGETPTPVTVLDLARATVQILALTEEPDGFGSLWSGSGSVITPDGLILTNAHVVDDRQEDYAYLGVAVLHESDLPPELTYLAEIAAVDYGLDLAVVRIISDLEGNPISPQLPTVMLGDSDQVEIGDPLQILGYPAIGGETVTFTEGTVSGFVSDRGVGGRAWIKTDATVAGGNSGGLGANAQGELIGVPTRASSGAEGDVVDCRPVADTNRDGLVDDRDTCVPIGGFINGLRPVNLALPLIEAAMSGAVYQGGVASQPAPAGGFDLSQTRLQNLVFSDGVTLGDRPTRILPALPSGVTDVCAFWDYAGMVDGMTWSAYWFVNREPSESGSTVDETWVGGEVGNWWSCIHDEGGLIDGLYEVVLEVEQEPMISDAVFVGGLHPMVDFILINGSQATIWFVNLSPSEARNWGQDELGPTEVLRPGETRVFEIPAGMYDLRVIDSNIETLAEDYGLDLTSGSTYTVGSAQPRPIETGPITVRLTNRLQVPVCYVFMSPTTDPSWGSDWLSPTEVIPAGASRGFVVPPGGSYDLQARDCDQNVLDERLGIEITTAGFSWTIGP